MPDLTLISHVTCPFVQRAAIALAEKRVPFARRDIDLDAKPDWFMTLSPTGKVPVLRIAEAGQVVGTVFESAVILEYLEETQPRPLHPADPLERADHRGWIAYAGSLLSALTGLRTAETEESFKRARDRLAAVLDILEARLNRRERAETAWFSDAGFSLVDATFAPAFRNYDIYDRLCGLDLLESRPLIAAWRTACARRDSVRDAVVPDFEERLTATVAGRDTHMARVIAQSPRAGG